MRAVPFRAGPCRISVDQIFAFWALENHAVMTPNDHKLSDGGGWRGLCRWVERWRRSAAQAVTAVAVRCSAWLGDLGVVRIIVSVVRHRKYRHLDACHREALLHSMLLGKVSCEDASCPPATSQKCPLDLSEKALPSIQSLQTASGSCRHEGRSSATTSLSQILLGLGSACNDGAQSPNDPKLSDGGAWRGSCEGGAQKEATDVKQSHDRTGRLRTGIAATVTRGAVRCSAWLGVAASSEFIVWRSLG